MSNCNKCNEPIGWDETEKGKWKPLNKDGTDHRQTCTSQEKKDAQAMLPEYKNQPNTYMEDSKELFNTCLQDVKEIFAKEEISVDSPVYWDIVTRNVATLFISRHRRLYG